MIEFLQDHANSEKASFHMPGHKGAAFFTRLGYGHADMRQDQDASEDGRCQDQGGPGSSLLKLQSGGIFGIADHDITEIPGADDLRRPDGIIKAIADKYSELYGSSRAFISVNGSSALIMAAILTCVKPGHKLLAAADTHISVRNGAELAGVRIVYAEPQALELRDITEGSSDTEGQTPCRGSDGPGRAGVDDPAGKQPEGTACAGKKQNGSGQDADLLAAPGSLANRGTEASPNCDGPSVACHAEEDISPMGDEDKAAGSTAQSAKSSGGSFRIPAGLSAKAVGRALDEDPDIDAVILPSPNYFGIVSDIKQIAEEAHKRGKVLIVDEAHGAHLKMLADAGRKGAGICAGPAGDAYAGRGGGGDLPSVPAEECGADIVIVSTHKTLASFTQTAVANIFGSRIDEGKYERKLLMLESTSPSYVLMESLAVNAEIMEKHGKELAASWRAGLDWFYAAVKEIPGVRVVTRGGVRRAAYAAGGICAADFDDTKIVVDLSGLTADGKEAEKVLMEEGIFPEFSTGPVVMFLTGIGNVRGDYELLADALAEMSRDSRAGGSDREL